ncbi:hypothetical protein DFQ29_001245, partial [Apophysomyces sp. BC1021]
SCDTYCQSKKWCYQRLSSIDLTQSHKGKDPFVVDGRCVVSAYVRVVKDPFNDN